MVEVKGGYGAGLVETELLERAGVGIHVLVGEGRRRRCLLCEGGAMLGILGFSHHDDSAGEGRLGRRT